MISKFYLLSEKPKKGLCGAFCGRSISEFINSCNLDQRDFVWLQCRFCIGISFSELQKEQTGEETILNWKSFFLSITRYSNFYTEIYVS